MVKECSHCGTRSTPRWRTDKRTKKIHCNRCGLSILQKGCLPISKHCKNEARSRQLLSQVAVTAAIQEGYPSTSLQAVPNDSMMEANFDCPQNQTLAAKTTDGGTECLSMDMISKEKAMKRTENDLLDLPASTVAQVGRESNISQPNRLSEAYMVEDSNRANSSMVGQSSRIKLESMLRRNSAQVHLATRSISQVVKRRMLVRSSQDLTKPEIDAICGLLMLSGYGDK